MVHQEVLFKGIGRVRDIVNGPDGDLYVVLNQPDRIERITFGNSLSGQPAHQLAISSRKVD